MINQFSRLLVLLRQEKKISQKQAADALGVSQALLSHYEKGIRECGLDFLVKAADFYSVSTDYLLGRMTDRNGAVLSLDDLPDENTAGKENTFTRGETLPILNKRLIIGALNILFELLTKIQNKELINEASADLMLTVYKCFRYVYSMDEKSPQSLFAAEKATFAEMATAAQQLCEMKIKCLTGHDISYQIKPINIEDKALILSQQDLERLYPQFASSLLNLILNSEIKMNARKR